MKIVLISDSHGNKSAINKIFETLNFDYLFFMGDGLGDLSSAIYLENVIAVSGNCDFFSSVPNERIFDINGKKFLITHGNKYNVKSNLGSLIAKAKGEKVDFAIFGHTHNKFVEKIGDIYLINPGSFQKNRDRIANGLILEISDNATNINPLEIEY